MAPAVPRSAGCSRTEHGHDLPAGDGIDAKRRHVAAELSKADSRGVGGASVDPARGRRIDDVDRVPPWRGIAHTLALRPSWGVLGALLVPARLPHWSARGPSRDCSGDASSRIFSGREPRVA